METALKPSKYRTDDGSGYHKNTEVFIMIREPMLEKELFIILLN